MRTLFANNLRFGLLIAAIIFCFAAVLAKLWWLHVRVAPELRNEAIQNRKVYRERMANRGPIVDMRGTLLATTREVWDIGVDPHDLSEKDEKRAAEVASVLGISVAAVEQAFARRAREGDDPAKPVPVRWVKLVDGQGEEMVRAVNALDIRGVYGNRRFVRHYPKGQLAAHLVGYINREGVPAMGVEKAMELFLRGQRGSIESQKDGRRTELAHLRIRQIDRLDGQKVELTIDSVLQEICEQALDKIAADYQPQSATVIISEPSTGKLLALGNWPTFDLNLFNDRVAAPLDFQRNRAVTDVYEPGSVFKIVPVSMGLNEGLITPNTVFDCGASSAPYRGKMVPMPKDSHPIGAVDVRTIVAKSSNRGSVLAALRVAEARGEQALYDYAYNFGFGRQTGLVTGTESVGILHKPDRWDGLTITRFPMGHAISATPLQMHYAMATIANQGRLMEPQLVNRIINPDGTVAFTYFPKHRGAPVKPEVAAEMVDMLRGVCAPGGTAAGAGIPGYDVAGKTGTTQKIINGTYSNRHHVASFSGFFPAASPQYAITIVVDEPKLAGVGYGGRVCVPIFRDIAEKVIRQFGLEPARPR